MQIVIDISDRKYKWMVDNPQTYTDYLDEAIRNGTPLPKGHGRLIDEDTIAGDSSWDLGDRLDATPTIIEADEESEE